MWKWSIRALLVLVLGLAGYAVFDYYRAGLHTRPEMPPGAFSLSYKNGLRGILIDVPNEKHARRYFGFPADVAHYIKDAWSLCSPPNTIENAKLTEILESREWPGERIEALCKIEVDEDEVITGYITSVPKL